MTNLNGTVRDLPDAVVRNMRSGILSRLPEHDLARQREPMKQEVPYQGSGHEPTKRLSVNLPESLHTRFETARSTTNRRLVHDDSGFRRTAPCWAARERAGGRPCPR